MNQQIPAASQDRENAMSAQSSGLRRRWLARLVPPHLKPSSRAGAKTLRMRLPARNVSEIRGEISWVDPSLLIGSLAVFGCDANIFLDIFHLQGDAINSVNCVAGIASRLLRPDASLNAAQLAFASYLNFLAQKTLQFVADTLQGIDFARPVRNQNVVAALAAKAAANGDCTSI